MRWLKLMLLAMGVLGMVCLGGYILYHVAYAAGGAAGYSQGYGAGEKIGRSSGSQESYGLGQADGYDLGQQAGYEQGYRLGEEAGYENGYVLGENDGYAQGYQDGAQAGQENGYALTDPTYLQAVAFMEQDRTNENEYIEDGYVCSHFARDVCNNAENNGLRCAYVVFRFPEGGHAAVAFNTIDQGLVCFDAQGDDMVIPVIGERYHQCIQTKPDYYYQEPDFDDTILDILVIW